MPGDKCVTSFILPQKDDVVIASFLGKNIMIKSEITYVFQTGMYRYFNPFKGVVSVKWKQF